MNFHTRKWVKPEDLNPNGTLFGGSLLACQALRFGFLLFLTPQQLLSLGFQLLLGETEGVS